MLRAGDEPRLAAMARSQTVTAAAAQRARIVLLAADGVPNAEIARRLGVTRPTESLGVTHWSARLLADQLGISFASVARIWRLWIKETSPTETFKFSTD